MKSCFELSITVNASVIDGNNHVNNQVYLQWMNDVAIAHANYLGSSLEVCLANGGSWFAREHTMTYLGAAFEGDELVITTWVTELTKISCMRHYKVCRAGEVEILFKGKTFWVFVHAQRGKPMKIPEVIRNCFTPIIVDDML